ncbi:MAG: hypothetical protein JSV49_00860 [Thermoplasmata archaeon]|nr:MAG: hypothetical protein JSV49_00860 [Thermoplasmata archaeon]
MSPRSNPWEEIPSSDRKKYQTLVDAFAPVIRLKPFDLWINFRAHHRTAILKSKHRGKHIARIQIAAHYMWDAPTIDDLKKIRPKWPSKTVRRWYERFERHVNRWGPGDIELISLILQREPTGADLDVISPSEFRVDEIQYRTGAHIKGVISQAWKGNWDKLGNIQVHYKISNEPFEFYEKRPILTIDSYHHSFYKPGEVPEKAIKWAKAKLPSIPYFPRKLWKHFKVAEKNRGAEFWELE